MKVEHIYDKDTDTAKFYFYPTKKQHYYFMFDLIEVLAKAGSTREFGFDHELLRFELIYFNASQFMYIDEQIEGFKSSVKEALKKRYIL